MLSRSTQAGTGITTNGNVTKHTMHAAHSQRIGGAAPHRGRCIPMAGRDRRARLPCSAALPPNYGQVAPAAAVSRPAMNANMILHFPLPWPPPLFDRGRTAGGASWHAHNHHEPCLPCADCSYVLGSVATTGAILQWMAIKVALARRDWCAAQLCSMWTVLALQNDRCTPQEAAPSSS